MKNNISTPSRAGNAAQRRILPITFEEHFWIVEVTPQSISAPPLQHFGLFSPGACRPADNPGGLSQITSTPRRLYLYRDKS